MSKVHTSQSFFLLHFIRNLGRGLCFYVHNPRWFTHRCNLRAAEQQTEAPTPAKNTTEGSAQSSKADDDGGKAAADTKQQSDNDADGGPGRNSEQDNGEEEEEQLAKQPSKPLPAPAQGDKPALPPPSPVAAADEKHDVRASSKPAAAPAKTPEQADDSGVGKKPSVPSPAGKEQENSGEESAPRKQPSPAQAPSSPPPRTPPVEDFEAEGVLPDAEEEAGKANAEDHDKGTLPASADGTTAGEEQQTATELRDETAAPTSVAGKQEAESAAADQEPLSRWGCGLCAVLCCAVPAVHALQEVRE